VWQVSNMIGFYDGGAVMTKGIEKKMVRRGGRGAKSKGESEAIPTLSLAATNF